MRLWGRLSRWRAELEVDHNNVEAARKESRETIYLLADVTLKLQAQTDRLKEALEAMGQPIDDDLE